MYNKLAQHKLKLRNLHLIEPNHMKVLKTLLKKKQEFELPLPISFDIYVNVYSYLSMKCLTHVIRSCFAFYYGKLHKSQNEFFKCKISILNSILQSPLWQHHKIPLFY